MLELLSADSPEQWDSVAFVDLAPVNNPGAVAVAVADVLGTRIAGTRTAAASLAVAMAVGVPFSSSTTASTCSQAAPS